MTGTWSLANPSLGQCSPLNATTTQCSLTADNTVIVSNAGKCAPGSSSIILEYRDLSLTCSPTTVRVGDVLNCLAKGGKKAYTWNYPDFIQVSPTSTNDNQILTVLLNNILDIPENNKFSVMVQDVLGAMKEVLITLIPPPLMVSDFYTIGNLSATKGTTQDLYVRILSPGGNETIAGIEVKMFKGAFSEFTPPTTSAQVFDVLDVGAEIKMLEENVVVMSGATTTYSTLYQLPMLIPDYQNLTNGTYTYFLTAFDTNLQETKAYLQTAVGVVTNGDINGDQSIDILDVVKVVMFFLNSNLNPSASELQAVDFNQNQLIDLTDVVKVIQEAMKE